jgi:hypothetical protein
MILDHQSEKYSNTNVTIVAESTKDNWWYHNDYIEGLDEELLVVEADSPPQIEQFDQEVYEEYRPNITVPNNINMDEFVSTAVPAFAGVMALRSLATTLAISFPLFGGAAIIGALTAHALFEEQEENSTLEEEIETSDEIDELIAEDIPYFIPQEGFTATLH